ncbi:hypothetical protein QUF90_00860 [Desulfococcaceae bacterium HSG9]|nr:hypothetical protein [Desulfococcaceae bacterium HSG9]
MARVVETVASEMGDALEVEIIYTKELDGALHYTDISKKIGRPAPVPSIFINGNLVFEQTPSAEELKKYLCKIEISKAN